MALDWHTIFVDDELSEVPLDEIAQGAALLVLVRTNKCLYVILVDQQDFDGGFIQNILVSGKYK